MDLIEIEKIPLAICAAQQLEQKYLNEAVDTKLLMDKINLLGLEKAKVGKNEEERKQMRLTFLEEHPTYQDYEKKCVLLMREAIDAGIDVDYHRNKLRVAEVLCRMIGD